MKFDSTATTFHKENAVFFARLSQIAYLSEEVIKKDLLELNLSFHKFLDADFVGSQGFVAISEEQKAVFIVFRGTQREEKIDFLVDLIAWPKSYIHGRAHLGFIVALDVLKLELTEVLKTLLKNQGRSLWLMGHSLGGALALLCSTYLLDQELPIRGIYTYGQPRIGNGKFKSYYEPRLKDVYFRLINGKDIVPQLPPFLMCYRHVKEECYVLDEDNKLKKTKISWFLYALQILNVLRQGWNKSEKFRVWLKGFIKRKPTEPTDQNLLKRDALREIKEVINPYMQYHGIENYLSNLQLFAWKE